jgi:aminoglycoside phosphotransferase (APT) family kinase protein
VLGRLSGRWPARRVGAELGLQPRGLALLWYGKTSQFDLPRMADDALWDHPAFAGDRQLRADLDRVVEIVPALIDQLDRLPEGLSHGDACPANMLHGDAGIVAVDWSYASSAAIGSDLGQLLAGAWVNGTADPDAIATTARTMHDGFVEGLAAERCLVAAESIELAFVTHLLVRAVFDAVATLPDVAPRVGAARVALARFAADRALSLQPIVC